VFDGGTSNISECLGCIHEPYYNYDCGDISVLNDFLEINNKTSESFSDVGCQQIWNEEGRLTNLILSYYGMGMYPPWCGDFSNIPESIGQLSALQSLEIPTVGPYENPGLTYIPSFLCDLPEECMIYLAGNGLCNEYHYDCFTDLEWGTQILTDCCEGPNGEPNWTQCP
jgi:hypothetical protein